jgi:hypothetical protein
MKWNTSDPRASQLGIAPSLRLPSAPCNSGSHHTLAVGCASLPPLLCCNYFPFRLGLRSSLDLSEMRGDVLILP